MSALFTSIVGVNSTPLNIILQQGTRCVDMRLVRRCNSNVSALLPSMIGFEENESEAPHAAVLFSTELNRFIRHGT